MSEAFDIVLPEGQLEGTSAVLASWLVEVGQTVKQGEPVAELETDKVVMEVCAANNGVISELVCKVGDKVAPMQVLGKMNRGVSEPALSATADRGSRAQNQVEAPKSAVNESSPLELGDEQQARAFISPAVRRLLRENDLQLEPIVGTGKRGRVTRDDVLNYLSHPPVIQDSILPPQQLSSSASSHPYHVENRQSRPLQGNMVPHSQMRKSIAAHMVHSLLETSPHVTSVFEMDMGNLIEHRKWHKKEFEALGVNLTFTAYFLLAMAQAIKHVPQVNARFHEEGLEIFSDVNIGVGTALGDSGLVVPVIEQVQAMNLFEVSKRLGEVTQKARDGKLALADMKNGTITISNHGVSGSLFATPIIINQPQVAILGVGKLEKRVVVESVNGVDTMVIRPKCYVSLSIDHRALDAHQTNLFLSHFVRIIENWGQ